MTQGFLFFLFLLLRFAKCKSDVFTLPTIKKNSQIKKISGAIKYISNKWGYDNKKWGKLEEVDGRSATNININVQNGKAICETENTLVKVKTYKHVFLGTFQSYLYYALYVHHQHAPGYINIVNPFILKVSKGTSSAVEHMLNKTEKKETGKGTTNWEEKYEEEEDEEEEKKIYDKGQEMKKEMGKDKKKELELKRRGVENENIYVQNKSVDKFPEAGSEFEGYLICEKKGEKALLIPKNVEEPEFLPAPWTTRVDIMMYKNPILPFGRQYAIIILDDINILKNRKKYFFLTNAPQSMVDVYYFHLAMKATKKKHFCKLSRFYDKDEIQLECDVTLRTWNVSTVNKLLASGFTFMNLANFIDYPFLKVRDLKYQIKEEDGNITYILLDFDGSPINAPDKKKKLNSEDTGQDSYVKHIEGRMIKKKLFLIKNGVFLSFWLLMNVLCVIARYFSVLKVLKEADRDLKKATTAYAWELEDLPTK